MPKTRTNRFLKSFVPRSVQILNSVKCDRSLWKHLLVICHWQYYRNKLSIYMYLSINLHASRRKSAERCAASSDTRLVWVQLGMHFSWKWFQILSNTIDIVIKDGLRLILRVKGMEFEWEMQVINLSKTSNILGVISSTNKIVSPFQQNTNRFIEVKFVHCILRLFWFQFCNIIDFMPSGHPDSQACFNWRAILTFFIRPAGSLTEKWLP